MPDLHLRLTPNTSIISFDVNGPFVEIHRVKVVLTPAGPIPYNPEPNEDFGVTTVRPHDIYVVDLGDGWHLVLRRRRPPAEADDPRVWDSPTLPDNTGAH